MTSQWSSRGATWNGTKHCKRNTSPTVATVNHCRQRRQAHAHFVSLLWWDQSALRFCGSFSVEDTVAFTKKSLKSSTALIFCPCLTPNLLDWIQYLLYFASSWASVWRDPSPTRLLCHSKLVWKTCGSFSSPTLLDSWVAAQRFASGFGRQSSKARTLMWD